MMTAPGKHHDLSMIRALRPISEEIMRIRLLLLMISFLVAGIASASSWAAGIGVYSASNTSEISSPDVQKALEQGGGGIIFPAARGVGEEIPGLAEEKAVSATVIDSGREDRNLQPRQQYKRPPGSTKQDETPSDTDTLTLIYRIGGGALVLIGLLMVTVVVVGVLDARDDARLYESRTIKGLGAVFLGLFLCVVVLSAWFTVRSMEQQARREAGQSLQAIIKTTHEALRIWVEERENDARQVSADPILGTYVEKLLKLPRDGETLRNSIDQMVIRELLSKEVGRLGGGGFSFIAPDAVIVGSTRDADLGTLSPISEQKKALLEMVFRGETVMVPPVHTDAPLENEERGDAGKRMSMFFMAPVKDNSGQTIAALAMRVDPALDFTRIVQLGWVGESGETYAFDKTGELITNSRFDRQLRQVGLVGEKERGILNIQIRDPGGNLLEGYSKPSGSEKNPLTLMARNATAGKAGSNVEGYRDYRGTPVMGAWLWDDHLGIGMATEIDVDEALASFRNIRGAVLIVLAITVVMALVLSGLTLWIGRSANRSLRRARDQLESRVEQRTKELSDTVREVNFQKFALDEHAIVSATDVKGNITYANDKFCEISGYSREELIGKNHRIIKSDEHPPELFKNMWRTIANGKTWRGDVKNMAKDGSFYWVAATIVPFMDERGKPFKYISIRTDITERKKAEESLEASRKKLEQESALLKTTMESIDQGFAVWDAEDRLVVWNSKCLDFWYYPKDIHVGMTVLDLLRHVAASGGLGPGDPEELASSRYRNRMDGESEEEFTMTDGRVIHLYRYPMPDGGRASVYSDISSRRAAEAERDRQASFIKMLRDTAMIANTATNKTQAIQEILDYVCGFLNWPIGHVYLVPDEDPDLLVPSGIWYLADKQKYATFQKATRETPLEKVIGLTDRAFKLEDPKWIPDMAKAPDFPRAELASDLGIKAGLVVPVVVNAEVVSVLEFFSSEQFDPDGTLFETLGQIGGILGRVEERAIIDKTLRQARKEAEAADRSKSDFLANMSHEIRTPMNAIIGMSYLAMQTDLTPKQEDYISKTLSAANSLLGIINDILDFSKIEAGKLEMESIPFRLEEALENLATLITVKTREKGLEFLISNGPDVPEHLLGDPLRLGQVLNNLANNAVKFTQEGEVIIKTELLKAEEDAVTLKFSVRDSGIGMTEEQIGRLFKAFSQADSSTTRQFGGTGLGLTICKQLVEMMDGEIWAESTPGEGSTFHFTARFGRHEAEVSERHVFPPELCGKRALVVDDNPDSREILGDMLRSFSFSVEEAGTGMGGLERIVSSARDGNPFDLVLMDWKMPEMDGIETIRRIQRHPDLSPAPPVILVTAYGREEAMRQCQDLDLAGVLSKPVTPSTLFYGIMSGVLGIGNASRAKRDHASGLGIEAVRSIRGARILLVEDNEVNQQVASELLEKAQLVVTIANNGQEAVDMVGRESFDCILMDVQMPVMDGYEATRTIRRDRRFKDLPIVAMTANAMAGDWEKCQAAGMNDHVAKPIEPREMYDALARWIEPGEREAPAEPMDRQSAAEETGDGAPLELPGFELASALARMGGSLKAYRKTLAKVRESEADALERIGQSLKKGDRETAIRAAHTLKGVAGTIGAVDLRSAAAKLEIALHEAEAEPPDGLMSEVKEQLDKAMGTIDAALPGAERPRRESAIDPSELLPLLESLRRRIENFDSTAAEKAEELLAWANGSELGASVDKLMCHLGDYDFDAASSVLNGIFERLRGAERGEKQ